MENVRDNFIFANSVKRHIWDGKNFTTKTRFCLFVWFDSLRPINNLSIKQGRVFLGWTSTKLGWMCLAQGPQRTDAGEARNRGFSVSSQALYQWATALPRHDLPTSVNDRVFPPFSGGVFSRNFAHAKVRENKTLAKNSEFTVAFF